jgi:hypothetical protein
VLVTRLRLASSLYAVDLSVRGRPYGECVRLTQRKGDVATARAIATFTAMGFDVSIPLTESAAYDLVVDADGELRRVQCKYIAGDQVDLRRIHSNAQGYVVKRSAENSYDWLYVLKSDGREYLLRECFADRRAVNPRASQLIGKPASPA